MINRIAALLMLAFQLYFLGEYIKTSLLPQYQMQIVLYGNSPMLLLVICCLVHLCVLIGSPTTSSFKRLLPFIYAAPYLLWIVFLMTKDHRELFNAEVTDGRSPLDPLFLILSVSFIAGYILLSVVILAFSWFRSKGENSELENTVNTRLSLLLETSFQYNGIEVPISFSAGFSLYPRDATDVTILMKIADESMYRTKRTRKQPQ